MLTQPNIIVILTDDQRWDLLAPPYMPRTTQRIAQRGIHFTNAFATTSVCGPSRSGFFTGDLASVHGVQSNAESATDFMPLEANTLATRMQAAGYYTAIVGKYLNGYEALGPPNTPTWHVPAGWDFWNVFANDFDSYVDATFVTGANTTEQVTQYTTDWIAERAKFVLDNKPFNQPAFVLVSPFGPHLGFDMQPKRYSDVLRNIPVWRPPSFNEPDVSDKSSVIQAINPIQDPALGDGNRRFMLEALLAVDDLVEVIWRVAQAMGNTVIVFMSDQGFYFGEHRLTGKDKPYDEAHRIPLAITYPGVQPRVESGLVTMQDITQTLLSWGGAAPLGQAGTSIAQNIELNQPLTRTALSIEGYLPGFAYTGVRTQVLKFFTWTETDESELYDLSIDPYELQNLQG